MKKLLSLALALMLLSSAALAESPLEEESAYLTYEEVEIYLDMLSDLARRDAALNLTQDPSGLTAASFSGGSLLIADSQFTESTAVLGVNLSESQEDPRGLRIGDTLQDLLDTYPNDNPSLAGSYYDAALYLSGEKPEMSLGFLLRDGQRVLSVTHQIYSWRDNGVIKCTLNYTLNQGQITAISITGMGEILDEGEALAAINDVASLQEVSEYFAYPQSENGATLAPFEREDLALRTWNNLRLDFLDITPEEAVGVLGQPNVDEWTEDSDGASLRLMQWEGISLLLQYDAQRAFQQVDSVTINDDVIEGPRGCRVGDYMDSVLFRFRHEDQMVDDNTVLLYGDGQTAPYGVLTYSPDGSEASYALALEGGNTVVWHVTFTSGNMRTMSLLLR